MSSERCDAQPLKTSDVYRLLGDVPERFNHPECFKGYESKPTHPLYTTTAQDYGGKDLTVHVMPTSFHGRKAIFTKDLAKTGMFKNNSFNTGADKSKV